jgi:hypothetical protein
VDAAGLCGRRGGGPVPRDDRPDQPHHVLRSAAGPDVGNDASLRQWIADVRAADLPHVHALTRGLNLDIQAATAALTLPFHNGRTEGVNTKTIKMIKRQMYGLHT